MKEPEKGEGPIGYSYTTDTYQIYAYIDEKIREMLKNSRQIPYELPPGELIQKFEKYEELPLLTEEAFLRGLAAHEVRHRVQCKLSITPIGLERELINTTDPILMNIILIECLSRITLDYISPRDHDRLIAIDKKFEFKEFDARIIEEFVTFVWDRVKLNDLEKIKKIASLIKMDGETLLKSKLIKVEEGKISLIFIVFHLILVMLILFAPDIYLYKANWRVQLIRKMLYELVFV